MTGLRSAVAQAAAALVLSGCSTGPGDPPGEATATVSGAVSEYVELARAHLQLGELAEVIAVCQAGLAADSTSAELLNLLATAYAGDGRYALATEALQKTVDMGASTALTYVNLGGIHTKLGQYAQAEEYLLHAAALAPALTKVRRRLAVVYLATNRYAEAAGQLETALRLYGEDETLYYFLGQALEGAGRDREALEAYGKAMELDLGFAGASYRAALLARQLGEASVSTAAMERYRHLQQIGDGDAEAGKKLRKLRDSILEAPEEAIHHVRLGEFFARHGYVEEALNKYEKAGRLARDDADLLNRVAGALVALQRPEEALEYYRRALRAEPDHYLALLNAGGLLSVSQRHEEALAHLQKAVALVPGDARGWYCLGLAQLKGGRPREARQSLQQSLELGPAGNLRERLDQLLVSLPPGP